MKVYRVIHIDGELRPEDWSWVPNQIVHPRAAEALFVTSSIDQALAWALHLYTNLDELKTHLLELEVSCIRDFNLKPTKKWMKSDQCSWWSDSELPFSHPDLKLLELNGQMVRNRHICWKRCFYRKI